MTPTTTTAPTPVPTEQTGPPAGFVHLYCCDPALSLCGADLSNGVEPATPADCPMCEVIDDLDEPCSPTCVGAA